MAIALWGDWTDTAKDALKTVVAQAAVDLGAGAAPHRPGAIVQECGIAELYIDRGETAGVVARLEQNAMVGDWPRFDAELAEAFGCAPAFAARITGDAAGEPLAVALAALYAPNDATVRPGGVAMMSPAVDTSPISGL